MFHSIIEITLVAEMKVVGRKEKLLVASVKGHSKEMNHKFRVSPAELRALGNESRQLLFRVTKRIPGEVSE